MGAVGDYFVTPHAVHRYRERIEDVPYRIALGRIIQGLNGEGAMEPKRLPEGTLGIRVRRPAPGFRVVVDDRPDGAEGELPQVVTVLESGR